MKANIISIGAGKAKTYGEEGNTFESAYKKDIYFNFCEVTDLGLVDDFQVDKRYHGGVDNAIHIGSTKHFKRFKELHDNEMDKLAMGCNILIDTLDESDVCVGDIYSIGDIQVEVSQPRQACWKVGAIYGKEVSRYILKNSATGWYVRVLTDGTLYMQDEMVLEKRVSEFTIKDLNDYLFTPPKDKELIQKILDTPALANAYKKDLQRAVEKKK